MSPALKYHFLSWVREGLAASIGESEDIEYSQAGPVTSLLNSTLALNDRPVKPPALTVIGPGDVIGFNVAQIVRMFPRPGVTDAEPTMFPLVEFDRPDLPWLATPRRGTGDRLRPWLCLVAVEGGIKRRPGVDVPVLETSGAKLPDPKATHLWAHAQLLLEDGETVAGLLGQDSGRLRTVSRLICPQLLRANTRYVACVVPTFKATVAAVLGEPRVDDLSPAWQHASAEVTLPVFASWDFSTGDAGGFEELVDRLRGRPLPEGVGRRRLYVGHTEELRVAGSDNVTELESALRSPAQDRMDPSLPEHSRRLAQIVGVGAKPADEPVVAPPAYGAHHARVRALDPDGEAWIDALNVDPRHRVAAGLGTTVMQREQERVMESAWRQLAAHREAERLRQMAVFARFVGDSLHRRHLQRLDDERAFALTAPAHGRVRSASGDAGTVAGAVHRSILPDATRALAFRRTLRPRGEIAARLGRITGDAGLAFQKQLTVLAKSGLARDYTAPDGTLALAADPRDVFVGAIAEATRLVFAEQGVDEGPAGLEVLSTSIAAEARLASLDASALSALPVPPGLAAELPVTHVPELARAQLTVTPGGLAEQLAFSGFALQREDGATFAAPKDDAGRFVPVEYVGDRFTFLSATGGAVSETTVKGPQRLQDLMLDERTAVRIAGRGSLADASLEFRSVAVAVPIAGLVNPVADVGLFAEVVSPVAEVVSPVADVVSPVAAAFHGVAPWSIGLLEVDEALADQVVVDHGGAASALVKWSAEQSVSLVGTAAALDKLPAHVGADDAGLAAALGAIAGLSSFPAAAAAKPSPFSLATEVAELRMAVEPGRALRKYLANVLEGADEKTAFEPVMWAPTFPDPMWKPLGDVSIEWILAGLERIPPNTVTLAETNGRFVEAFMVGLNHELGREMVWREFPTDQRGTGFARFWGRGVPDIEPIADWSAAPLGKHRPAGDEERLVLVVRGDLLRRYPGTIVFAAPDREGRADFDAAPKLPVFEGRLGAEYRFLGFDMSEKEARDAPWWFVFAEQPSEPRFGLDLPEEAWGGAQTYIPPRAETGEDRELIEAKTWNNAGWHHVVESGHVEPGMHAPQEAPNLKLADREAWGTHAADVARITFQQPVRASLVATKMLPPVDPVSDAAMQGLRELHRQQELSFRRADA